MLKKYNGSNWVDYTTLKKNNGTNWVDCSSLKRYNGTSWIEVLEQQPTTDEYIYNLGDQCNDITGGWVDGRPVGAITGFTDGTCTYGTSAITLEASSSKCRAISPNNVIDTTQYTKAVINYDVTSIASNSEGSLKIGSVKYNYSVSTNAVALDVSAIGTGKIAELNLSGYNDSYYFSVVAINSTIKINSIILIV